MNEMIKENASDIVWNREGFPPGDEQDSLVRAITGEVADRGFVVANVDKVVNWARQGSMWPMTFGGYARE